MKLKILYLSLFIIFISPINSIFEDLNIFTEITTLNQFQEFVSSKDRTICIYIYNSIDCQKCEQANPVIEKFSDDMEGQNKNNLIKFTGIIEFGILDCDTLWEDKASQSTLDICHPKNTTQLPQLLFFQPPQNRFDEDRKTENSPQQHIYQGPVDIHSLATYTKTIIPSFHQLISTQNELDDFLSFTAIPNKVILFTNKQETPILFRGLTSHYREKIEFAEIKASAKSLVKKYKVKSFPQLIILKLQTDGSYQEINYQGNKKFEPIKQYLAQFALERRLIKPKDRALIKEDQPPEFIKINQEDFESSVIQNENYVFLNLFKEKDENYQQQLMDKFEHIFDYYEMDCSNQENLEFVEKQFKIKSFPKTIYFPNGIIKNKLSKKIIFSKDDQVSEMMAEIVENFKDPIQQLNQDNIQPFILEVMENQLTPIVLSVRDKHFEEIFYYMAYANQQKWNDRLVFGIALNPSSVFKKILNLKKIPSLISVLGKNQDNENDHQVAHFSGGWDARQIRGFIYDVTIIYSRSLVKLPNEQKVIEINNQELIEKKCSGKYQYCFIGFFEGHDRFHKKKGTKQLIQFYQQDKKLNSQLDILYTIENEFGSRQFTFNWIDGQCYLDLLSRLYIINPLEELPIFIAYNQDSMKYVYLTKDFNEYNARNFVKEVKEGKLQWIKPKEALDIDEKNCKQFHENYVPISKPKKKKSKKEDL